MMDSTMKSKRHSVRGKVLSSPEPAKEGAILRAFTLFGEHERKKTVARILNQEGFRTPNGSLWSDVAVDRLLCISKAQVKDIVPDELFDRCREILSGTGQEKHVTRKSVHLFAGLLNCACGGKMYVPSNSPKYVCPACRNKIPISDLEAVYAESLKDHALLTPEEHGKIVNDREASSLMLGAIWPDLDAGERRHLVELLTTKVIFGQGKITICLRHSSSDAVLEQQGGDGGHSGEGKSLAISTKSSAPENIRLDVSARELYRGGERLTGSLSETTRNFLSVLGYQIANKIDAPLPWDEPFSENATATTESAVRMLRKQLGTELVRLILKLERKRGEKPGGVRLVNVEVTGSGRRDFLTRG